MNAEHEPIWDEIGDPPRYFDMESKPMTMRAWAELFEDHAKRRIAEDVFGDVRVSTVWLGLNHRFMEGPPLIFETMVFGGPLDQEMNRYTTKQEAIDGHAEMVQRVKEVAR